MGYSKLRLKIIVTGTLTLVVIGIVLYLSYLNHRDFEKHIVSQAQQHLLTIARTAAGRVQDYLDEHMVSLSAISLNPIVQKKALEEKGHIHTHNALTCGKDCGPCQEYCPIRTLHEIEKSRVDSLTLHDANGIVLCTHPFLRPQIGRDCSKEPDVAFILKERKPYVGQAFHGHGNLGASTVSLSVPIFYGPQLAGIIQWAISLEKLHKRFIEPIRVEGGHVWILNEEGMLLSHQDTSQIGQHLIAPKKAKYPEHDWSKFEQVVERMTSREEGIGVFDCVLRGKRLISFAPFQLERQTWSVGVAMDYSQISEPITQHAIKTMALAVLVMGFLFTGGYALYRVEKRSARDLAIRNEELRRQIAERLLAEEALRGSEQKLAGIVDSVTDCMIMVDRDFTVVWANDLATALFGSDLVGQKCYAAYHDRTQICESCIVKQALEDGNVHDFETEIVNADGQLRTFWCTASVAARYGGENTRPTMVVEFLRDITDRKLAEKALAESEHRFRVLVENSLIGIFIIQNNQIVYKNPEQERLFGPLPSQLEIAEFKGIHPHDVAKWRHFLQQLLSGKTRNLEIEVRFYPVGQLGVPAEMRWALCRASSIEYKGREAALVNMMDITRTKELEHLVVMRQKMASLGHVAAGIAHEIRNPLSGINVYLSTLSRTFAGADLEPEHRERIWKIMKQLQSASDKIESVIRRVIDFSKPSQPKFVLTDLNQSIEEALSLSSVALKRYGVTIRKSLADNLPKCYADPHLVEQVILNLITNAAQALENTDDMKEILVTSAQENSRIVVKVSDSGPGIPPEIREKIFDPFFTTKSDSSGIGLALSHRIISDHGGSLNVTAGQLKGAEFTIEIPLKGGRIEI